MGGPIDPIEYDTVELRELARRRGDRYLDDGFLWAEPPESLPSLDEVAEHDRPVAWTGSLEERQKPYLHGVPGTEEGRRIAREWVRGLVERAGSGGAVEALAYYESLGWLTETAREEVEDYLLAVDYRPGGSLADLSRADHVESLARTARLARLADADADEDADADGDGPAPDRGVEEPGTDDPRTDASATDAPGTDPDGPAVSGFEFGTRTE